MLEGWREQGVVDEETEGKRRHTTDGVIGSWEISRSLFLEGGSADAEVSIMTDMTTGDKWEVLEDERKGKG